MNKSSPPVMTSDRMYGLIDVPRRKWKDSIGNIATIRESRSGELLCPLCHVDGHDEVLRALPDHSGWACARQHGYHVDSFPE